MEWNTKQYVTLFPVFLGGPEVILYPALDPKNLDLSIPNPKIDIV